jgi:phosphodiesterase/alkaline phosphatase D-like protein
MKIAFCSCNHPLVQPSQPGWLAVTAKTPDVLLLLGDNVYLEDTVQEVLVKSQRPSVRLGTQAFAQRLHARYRAQANVPEFRTALQACSVVLGTLDDHDFLGNDQYVQAHTQDKAQVARLLHRQFIAHCNLKPLPLAYPSLASALAAPDTGFDRGLGVASSLAQEQVKIMLLDNRSYRQSPHSASAVALGAAQVSWLAQNLVGSQRVSIVASGSTLSPGNRYAIRGSPLADYPQEARMLRTLYQSQRHQVVLHIGGDVHYNTHWPERAAQDGFSELASSGMGTGLLPFSQHTQDNFGFITVTEQAVDVQLSGKHSANHITLRLPLATTVLT